jgi:hypothetical protein
MARFVLIGVASGLALLAGVDLVQAAQPRIEMEVCTAEGFSLTGARDWSKMLSELGLASVRIRGARADDAPAINKLGNDDAPTYHVVGILAADGKLSLPKGKFALSDKARLTQWLDKLRSDGIEAIAVKPAAFGLVPSQLVKAHEALAVPVRFSTRGQTPRDAAKKIADSLTLRFVTDPASQRALATTEPVADELRGLSSGTALAAVLRPLGLVMFPEKEGSQLRLRIADGRSAPEHWPVGWPVKSNPGETVPDLFKSLSVEIADNPLGETLAAIAGRVKTPLVIDYNALARLDVDLSTTKVSVPRTSTFYAKVLDRVLAQANLKYEIRLDEADKPFLWVTSIR